MIWYRDILHTLSPNLNDNLTSRKCSRYTHILWLSSLTDMFLHVTAPKFVSQKIPEIPNSIKNIPIILSWWIITGLMNYTRKGECSRRSAEISQDKNTKRSHFGEGNSTWWWRCRGLKWQNHGTTLIACLLVLDAQYRLNLMVVKLYGCDPNMIAR